MSDYGEPDLPRPSASEMRMVERAARAGWLTALRDRNNAMRIIRKYIDEEESARQLQRPPDSREEFAALAAYIAIDRADLEWHKFAERAESGDDDRRQVVIVLPDNGRGPLPPNPAPAANHADGTDRTPAGADPVP